MYTIKEAAARAGVTVPLLRAWERRYRVVQPERTPAGYRLYTDEAVRRLRAVQQLIGEGWTAGNAAAAVRDMDGAAVAAIADRGALAPTVLADETAPRLIERFVAAAERLDAAALEGVLDEAFASGSFEQVADAVLMPMLTATGDAWEAGQLDVASEHAASHAMLRRLAAAFEAAGRPLAGDRPVLVGMPPGSRHDLGALAFATAASRAALPVVYLGPDLPVANWVEAAATTHARAAVIGVVARGDVEPARRVYQALHGERPELVVAFGGARAAAAARAGGLQLAERLTAAVDQLRDALA
jgi:DNA-binding transcriptional MerR regulator/methylmalonyl-CoA mutase cobalamin-binding subunit